MNIKKSNPRIFIIIFIIISHIFTYFKRCHFFMIKMQFSLQNLKINSESKRFSWYELMS